MTARILCLMIALAAACTEGRPSAVSPAAAPVAGGSAAPTGDQLFVDGKFAEAVAAYQREIERGERVVELQTMIAVARLADVAPGFTVVDDLHQIERQYPRSRWGVLAGVLAAELDRSNVLRQAAMDDGADLRAARDQVDALTAKLAAAGQQLTDAQAQLATVREDRGHLQTQLREQEDKTTAQEAHIRDLETELSALKQVDMQRRP